jgi:hypothetical protein
VPIQTSRNCVNSIVHKRCNFWSFLNRDLKLLNPLSQKLVLLVFLVQILLLLLQLCFQAVHAAVGINLRADLFCVTDTACLHHVHTVIHQVSPHLFKALYLLWMAALQEADQTWSAALLIVI